MRHLYLDIFSGLSGDMFLGALLDLGVELKAVERELKKLPVDGYHLHQSRQQRSAISGVKFDVHFEDQAGTHDHSADHGGSPSHAHAHEHPHPPHPPHHASSSRDHRAIRQLISQSALSEWVKSHALAVFQRIAVAEGKIHGVPPESVHFHEVGAVDSIVDIVGGCIALELLGCPTVSASAVIEGIGLVKCAHGFYPIPTVATLEILGARGIALTQCEEPHELVTPTGAALLAEFATRFGPMQSVIGSRVGYGLGTRENRTRPNVVRVVFWEDLASEQPGYDWETDAITVLETNLDDSSGEVLGHVVEKALRMGALDAFHVPVQMKKQRPGVILTLLCEPTQADALTQLLLTETSAFGVRRTSAERRKLRRTIQDVKTEYGTVKLKLGQLNGAVVQAAPEFESVKSIAAMAGVPVKTVLEAALTAYHQDFRSRTSR